MPCMRNRHVRSVDAIAPVDALDPAPSQRSLALVLEESMNEVADTSTMATTHTPVPVADADWTPEFAQFLQSELIDPSLPSTSLHKALRSVNHLSSSLPFGFAQPRKGGENSSNFAIGYCRDEQR
jgi:hypothetical protein